MPHHSRISSFLFAVICILSLTRTTVYSEKSSDTGETSEFLESSGSQVAPRNQEATGSQEAPDYREAPDHQVAVVIEVTAPSATKPESGLSFALAIGLDSYVDYFLSQTGADFQLFRTDSMGLRPSFLKSIQDSGFTTIVTLQPAGKFTTDKIPMLDKRRRQFFVSIGQQLRLKLRYRISRFVKGNWHESGSGTVKARPRRPWFVPPPGPSNRTIDSLIAVTSEPIEFIIMRSVQELFGRIHLSQVDNSDSKNHGEKKSGEKKGANGDTNQSMVVSIPTTIVYDALSSSEEKDWQNLAGQLIAYVNRLLRAQFAVEMSPVVLQKEWLGHGGVEPLANVFKRLESNFPARKDSLVIGLYGERRGIDFFRLRNFDAVGFGKSGSGLALVKLFPSTRKEIENWRPFLTGRSLIHELGHVFGGIHTSDLNSIMNQSATWLSPGHFDPLNREIIKATLRGKLELSDRVAYARFLSSAITRLGYGLADFPPVFYRLLNESKINQKRMRKAIGDKTFILSAEGFGALREGKLTVAASRFRESVKLAPEQASLYYYLSLCTGGAESINALSRAASLGYNLAREKIRLQSSQMQESR